MFQTVTAFLVLKSYILSRKSEYKYFIKISNVNVFVEPQEKKNQLCLKNVLYKYSRLFAVSSFSFTQLFFNSS